MWAVRISPPFIEESESFRSLQVTDYEARDAMTPPVVEDLSVMPRLRSNYLAFQMPVGRSNLQGRCLSHISTYYLVAHTSISHQSTI